MSNEKRYDTRHRRLYPGEVQLTDPKEKGKYKYFYTDEYGKRHNIASWRLLPTDAVPEGKKKTKSLRELEEDVKRQMNEGLRPTTQTLENATREYMDSRSDWRPGSRATFESRFKVHIKGQKIGKMMLADIRYSDMRRMYAGMIKSGSMTAAETLNHLLNPVFEIAVRDDFLKSNPNRGAYVDAKRKLGMDPEERLPLTQQQQADLLKFVSESDKFTPIRPVIITALGTGLRAGELFGLTWNDIDFETGCINVNHQLTYIQNSVGNSEFHIGPVKSKSGNRIVPMLKDVRDVLESIRSDPHPKGTMIEVDGMSGFIFKTRLGRLWSPTSANSMLYRIVSEYNQNADPEEMLPHISMHIFRHTFCSRLCAVETNMKRIQTIMGHADISTTMNIYAKFNKDDIKNTLSDLDGKLSVL